MTHQYWYSKSGESKHFVVIWQGFPGGWGVKNLPANAGDTIWSLAGEDHLEKETSTPVFLPGKTQAPRSLAGYSPWGCKQLNTT